MRCIQAVNINLFFFLKDINMKFKFDWETLETVYDWEKVKQFMVNS